MRRRVVDILMAQRVRARDYLGEIKALFEWVQSNIRYTRDPHRVELLHSARRMLELRAGDCDDMTILLGAMLQSIGHPVRIVVVGPNPSRPRIVHPCLSRGAVPATLDRRGRHSGASDGVAAAGGREESHPVAKEIGHESA